MGEYNDYNCPPKKDCCPPPPKPPKHEICKPICGRPCCYEPRCENDGLGIIGILILLVVLYFIFCNNNDKGGLFGGLF